MRRQFLIATLFILACSSSAHAYSVKWTLTDVMFMSLTGNTSTAEGSFEFDADIGGAAGFSNVLIKTASAIYDSVADIAGEYGLTSNSGSNYIVLALFDPMTNAGGRIDIVPFISHEGILDLSSSGVSGDGSIIPKPQRGVVKGSIVSSAAVKLTEPSTIIVFLLGALGISMLRRRATF